VPVADRLPANFILLSDLGLGIRRFDSRRAMVAERVVTERTVAEHVDLVFANAANEFSPPADDHHELARTLAHRAKSHPTNRDTQWVEDFFTGIGKNFF